MAKMKIDVQNAPDKTEKYVVARPNNGYLWYWGSWADKDTAYEVSDNIGGVVCEND